MLKEFFNKYKPDFLLFTTNFKKNKNKASAVFSLWACFNNENMLQKHMSQIS